LHFAALAGLFPPKRNILKNWSANEEIFVGFVKKEGKIGIEHFMQALVLFFIRKYKGELDKYAQTLMKKLVDENVLSEKFVVDWFDKTLRLDKDSKIYDKKAEKKFRDLIETFVEWLKAASSGSDDSSSEEEANTKEADTTEATEEAEVAEDSAPAKTEAQLRAETKQKEQIEKMKAQQTEALARAKAKVEEEEEKQAAAAEAMENNRE